MLEINKIGIVGVGQMGEALLQGFLRSNQNPSNIVISEHHSERESELLSRYGVSALPLSEIAQVVDQLWLCTKPQQMSAVLADIKEMKAGGVVVSIAAGLPLSYYEKTFSEQAIIRVMPNTPVLVGQGMSVMTSNAQVKEDQKESVSQLLASVGRVIQLEEDVLDAVTGLSGSGPAFLYRFTKQMAAAATEHGLTESVALELVAQTMIGAGTMMLNTEKVPAELIQDVLSPGGTTEAGMSAFDESQIDIEIKDVVHRAILRSKELGVS